MWGYVGDENPVVIDSLWTAFIDTGRDVEEEEVETCKMEIDIDTSKLTDDEADALIDKLGYIGKSWGYEKIFSVDYVEKLVDGEWKIMQVKLRGDDCEESVYIDAVGYLQDFKNIEWKEN